MEDMFFPKDVNISNGLMGSKLRRSEFETIARNLVIVSRVKNEWLENFTLAEYKKRCSHTVSDREIVELNSMVDEGFLKIKDGTYMFTTKMFEVYRDFIKK
ncbi:MAG: hypothetical protein K0R72_1046 [Clostridia bacterium]|jgi:hypothetical protein|nr:hypothetical protein [Clostridia bacterium]